MWDKVHAERIAGQLRKRKLRLQYGLTVEQYDQMLLDQWGGCGLCAEKCKSGDRLAVDHDHETGKVRALLCKGCNARLGVIEDAVFRDKASAYLAYYKQAGGVETKQ